MQRAFALSSSIRSRLLNGRGGEVAASGGCPDRLYADVWTRIPKLRELGARCVPVGQAEVRADASNWGA